MEVENPWIGKSQIAGHPEKLNFRCLSYCQCASLPGGPDLPCYSSVELSLPPQADFWFILTLLIIIILITGSVVWDCDSGNIGCFNVQQLIPAEFSATSLIASLHRINSLTAHSSVKGPPLYILIPADCLIFHSFSQTYFILLRAEISFFTLA